MADERVGIVLSIEGGDVVIRTMREALQLKGELLDNKNVSIFNADKARSEIIRVNNELKNYLATRNRLINEGKNKAGNAEWDANEKAIRNARSELQGYTIDLNNANKEIKMISDGVKNLEGQMSSLAQSAEVFANAFSKVGELSALTHDLASSIGSAFSGMSDLFSTNFINVVGQRLTEMLTDAFVGHGQQVMSRADILNTFTDYMELTGVTATQAEEALDRVDQSIRGLPIGLDESAQRLRRYQMFMGDIDRATNVTIGLQKAITAGGANESMKRMAYYQIDRLLSAGDLSTQRQWYSLITGLGVSMRFLADAMEVGDISAGQLASGLATGVYSADQLLDALARLGEGSSKSAQGLERALEIYKGTYESWWSNIQFAMVRGATNMLNAMSDVFEESTGKGIVGYMKDVRDGLNEMYSGISRWIRSNPDLFGNTIDSVTRLLGAVQSLQFGTFGTKVLENIAKGIDLLTISLGKLPGEQIAEFAAFATTLAGPIGKVFGVVGQKLPQMLGVFERFKDFEWEYFIDSLIKMTGAMAKIVEVFLDLFSDKVLGNVMAFGLVFGKPVAGLLNSIGRALSTIAIASGGAIAPLSGLTTAMSGLAASFSFALPIIGAVAAALATLGAIQGYLSNNPPTTPLGNMLAAAFAGPSYAIYKGTGYDYVGAAVLGGPIGLQKVRTKRREDALAGSYADLGYENISSLIEVSNENRKASESAIESSKQAINQIEVQEERAKSLISTIRELNSAERLNADQKKEMLTAVTELNSLYDNWSIGIDNATGKLDDSSVATIHNAEALQKMARVSAEESLLDSTTTALVAAETQRKILGQERQDLIESNKSLFYKKAYREIAELEKELGDASTWNQARQEGTWYRLSDEARGQIDNWDEYLNDYIAYKKVIGEIDDEISVLDKDIAHYESTTKTLAKTISEHIEQTKKQVGALAALEEGYEALKLAAKEAFEEQDVGFDKLEEKEAMAMADIIANAEARLKQIQDRTANANTLEDYLTPERFEEYIEELGEDYDLSSFEGLGDINKENFFSNLWAGKYGDPSSLAQTIADGIRSGDHGQVKDAIMTLIEQYIAEEIWQEAQARTQENAAQVTEGFAEMLDGMIMRMSEAEDEAEAAAIRVANAAEIGQYLEKHRPEAEAAAALLAQAVEAGLISREDAIILAAKNIGEEAAAALKAALSNISVDVNVSLRPHIDTGSYRPSGFSGFTALPKSTGGPIYAANGRLVSWIPKGTDTVPAMLTPGEFVHNRNAVKMFGLPFMEAVNGLNIDGALRSLLSMKNIVPGLATGGSVTNNYSRDNHATVNQTIISNNQNYSQRVALRALGRL